MKGDFTRDSFSPSHGYTRVLAQQGRVQLDADWNEQISILWDYWRSLVVDLVGPHAGPHGHCGFGILCPADFSRTEPADLSEEERRELKELLKDGGDFLIGAGNYYVDGFLCRNDFPPFTYTSQPYFPDAPPVKANKSANLVYLDVWERHLTQIEDPRIGEVALEGVDTTTRAKLIWQIRTLELAEKHRTCKALAENWEDLLHEFRGRHRAYLRAMAKMPADEEAAEAALGGPQAQYRGTENRLYRVEIHDPGPIGDQPTFKWSRANGTVIFPILSIDVTTVPGKTVVTLGDPARDSRAELNPGDMVEMVDDAYILQNRAEPLLPVASVDAGGTVVTLGGTPVSTVGQDKSNHPLLRRWDQKAGNPKKGGLELRNGAALIREGIGDAGWVMLEDGVQIQFVKTDPRSYFSTGDYWLIPARTTTGDVLWPRSKDKPAPLRPHGPQHHFAPLAIVEFNKDEQLKLIGDCRPKFRRDVPV
jgi:hypothetical protein